MFKFTHPPYCPPLTRADPTRRFDLVLADRSWQLRRSPVGVLPYFDGWCFLAAMRFLANTAGVTDDHLCLPLTARDPAAFHSRIKGSVR